MIVETLLLYKFGILRFYNIFRLQNTKVMTVRRGSAVIVEVTCSNLSSGKGNTFLRIFVQIAQKSESCS